MHEIDKSSALARVRVVMVDTSHPGNIGAAARAMKNMHLSQLYLVKPQLFPHAEATSRASGADDILAQAKVCATLPEALHGCALVFGASARRRTIPWPLVDARSCAGMALEQACTGGEVAIVFGREHSGLTNDELELCNYLMHIPSNSEYSSLNVAAAIQVVAYELNMATLGEARIDAPVLERQAYDEPATADEIEGFFQHLEHTLTAIEFFDPDNPRQLMRRLRRLYNRTHLEKTEVNILRGILKTTLKASGK